MEGTCELCGDEPAVLEFNCVLPSFGLIVKAPLGERCFANAENDMALAVDIIKKRANMREIPLPVTAEQLPSLCEPSSSEFT